jgi:hypothetical protein
MKTSKRQIQGKLKNRRRISAGVQREIRKAIEATAQRYNCSMAFVQNVALAEFFGLEPFEDFRGQKAKTRTQSQAGATVNRRSVSTLH